MRYLITLIIFASVFKMFADTDANIFGDVQCKDEHLPFVSIEIPALKINTVTDKTGHYKFINLPPGEYKIIAKMIGYETSEKSILVEEGKTIEVDFELIERVTLTKEVVVTGTKTKKLINESAIKVDVLNNEKLNLVQANNLSESLNYIPGLRLEIDCQTCNYSQLRMNGLGGAYSQILINGKSLFSPLTGLYGLEQIPANMIDKIEVVKGGGSALYGSSSIGGTVNIITKTPNDDSYSMNYTTQTMGNSKMDNLLSANISVMNDNRKAGLSIFASKRDRDSYDHNSDGFSEIPKIENNSFGLNAYIRPSFNHRIDINASSIYEYRRGGDNMDSPPHEAEQSEERRHNVFMSSVEYEYYFNDFFSSFSTFIGFQKTNRVHYTGIIPDIIGNDSSGYYNHFLNPPYGNTLNSTIQSGMKINHLEKIEGLGAFDITAGIDYLFDDVSDKIRAYNYEIDQISNNIGFYGQLDWKMLYNINFLAGVRVDKHNLIDKMIINPRISLLWDIIPDLQFRIAWASGFRAPQAFDSDMHVAFSGGGVQFIKLADDLKEESSKSISGSIIYDIFETDFATGFTLDGFYTILNNAFVLEEVDNVNGSSILEKRNGGNSNVLGATLEYRLNIIKLFQFEASYTIQQSKYDEAIKWSEELPGVKDYLRTPSQYGYSTISLNLWDFVVSLTGVYTGSMLVAHYGVSGNPGTPEKDELKSTESFLDMSSKISYKFALENLHSDLEIYLGVKNILNSYQSDFDKGKFRDSNYIYGPAQPRTLYLGVKFER